MRRARQLVAARLVAVGQLTRADARAFDVRPATLAMDAATDPKAFRTRFTGEVMRFLRAWALAGGNPSACDVDLAALDAAYDFKRLAETAHRPPAREHRGDVHRPPALDVQAKHLGHVVETIGWMFEMAGNDDKDIDNKGVDENGTSPRFSSHATSRGFLTPPPRGSPHTFHLPAVLLTRRGTGRSRVRRDGGVRRRARGVARHPEVFARLARSWPHRARETSRRGRLGAGVGPVRRVDVCARGDARWTSATEPQHARDARDGVEALASAGGFEIPRETWDALDAADARWRRRETAFIAAQYTFGQGLAAARGVPLRPDAVADRDAATAKAAKHLSGKSLAAVAKAWARRARFHGATPDEDAVAALVDALPNAEPPATFAELELIERALLDLLDERWDERFARWHYEARRDRDVVRGAPRGETREASRRVGGGGDDVLESGDEGARRERARGRRENARRDATRNPHLTRSRASNRRVYRTTRASHSRARRLRIVASFTNRRRRRARVDSSRDARAISFTRLAWRARRRRARLPWRVPPPRRVP